MVSQAKLKAAKKHKLKVALKKFACKALHKAVEAKLKDLPVEAKVRILDEKLKEVYFGKTGEVQAHEKGQLKVVTESCMTIRAKAEQVEKLEGLKKARKMKGLNSMSKDSRRHFLFEAGYGQEEETDFEDFKKDLEDALPRLWNGHVSMLQAHLLWSLEVEAEVISMVHPVPILTWLEACEGEGDPEVLQRFREVLQAQARRGQKVLVPIWAANGKGGGGEHWTLLVLDRRRKEVRYYDSLEKTLQATRGVRSRCFP